MNALICFGSRYGSTRQVCEDISIGMGIPTSIRPVSEVDCLDYDIVVIGTPVFIGKPMKTVTEFITAHSNELKDRNIALFVTCWAASTQYAAASSEFISQVAKYLPACRLLSTAALPGKLLMDQISEADRKLLNRLLRRIGDRSDEFDPEKIIWKDARNKKLSTEFGKDILIKLNNHLWQNLQGER